MSSQSLLPRIACGLLLLLLPATNVDAQRRGSGQQSRRPGTGNPDEHLVPWKFLEKGSALAKQPLVLYWMPASLDDVDRSPLNTSHVLLENASWCLGLEIVSPDDAATIGKLGATGKLPMAVLTDGTGKVIRSVEHVRGGLRAASVEQMVSDEFNARDEAMYRDMTQAKRFAMAGERQRAIDLYKKVWDDRCLFPVGGTEAQRALKDLGVIVKETPPPPPVDPYLQPKTTTTAPPATHTGH